jgi:hypothetical protein
MIVATLTSTSSLAAKTWVEQRGFNCHSLSRKTEPVGPLLRIAQLLVMKCQMVAEKKIVSQIIRYRIDAVQTATEAGQ